MKKRQLINKSIIKSKLYGISTNVYYLEKLDKYTYRMHAYANIPVYHRLGYDFKVSFDYNSKSKYTTYLIETSKI